MSDMLETGTPYARIIPGSTKTLDVVWSESGYGPGRFFYENLGNGLNTKILLNMKSTDLYQNGVPGISDDVEGVAEWVRTKIAYFEPKHVRSFGHSAGGSAAIGFGHAIKADTVIAVSPEIELGVPGYRSFDRSFNKKFHPKYRNLARYVRMLGNRLTLVFGGYDTSDFRHIYASKGNSLQPITYIKEMHSGMRAINWTRIASTTGPVKGRLIKAGRKLRFKFDKDAVWRGAAAYEAIGNADGFAAELLEDLMKIDPNPGIKYRLSLQKAILGDFDTAGALWQEVAAEAKTITLKRITQEYRLKLRPGVYRAVRDFYKSISNNAAATTDSPQEDEQVGMDVYAA